LCYSLHVIKVIEFETGGSRCRCDGNIKTDLRKVGCEGVE